MSTRGILPYRSVSVRWVGSFGEESVQDVEVVALRYFSFLVEQVFLERSINIARVLLPNAESNISIETLNRISPNISIYVRSFTTEDPYSAVNIVLLVVPLVLHEPRH